MLLSLHTDTLMCSLKYPRIMGVASGGGQGWQLPPCPHPCPPRNVLVFATALPVIMLGSRLPNKCLVFVVKILRVHKLSHIQIACVLNNLNCKLRDIVAGYSIHAFVLVSIVHCVHGVGLITSMA